mgnify:FL=1
MKRFLSIIAISSLPLVSQADTYNVSDKFYVGLGAGMISPNNIDLKASQSVAVNGLTFSADATGELSFDNGYQITGLLGYRINEFLSFETELGYTNFDYDKLTGSETYNITSGGQTFSFTAGGTADVDGNISAFSMIFGPTLDFDVYENLELLLGGGIGFSSYNDEVKSIGGVNIGFDEDYTNFAAKFKTGANYSFTEQTYVQATYGFNYVDSNIENLTSSDFTAHSFNAKVVFNF